MSQSFGALLRQVRLAEGLTQATLAERAGLSERTIQELERTAARPRRDTMRRLIAALKPAPGLRAQLEAVTPTPRRRASKTADQASLARRSAAGEPRQPTLPIGRSRLIGREQESAALRQLLLADDVGHVTLTGAGGVGKTRLALHVASSLHDTFGDGVYIVELAPLADPTLVASTMAQALGVPLGGRPAPDALREYLRDRAILLVLDNFEHLLDAATLVPSLLDTSAGLKVLVTSRAPLRVRGEHEYEVPPLQLPDPRHPATLEVLSGYGAVALFVERARAIRGDFALTDENANAVIEICTRLDGLPLAIELVVPRVRVLSPQALVARLERRLPLLIGGTRDAPARQRTLRDTIAWSHDLLDQPEERLFRRLAVFVGGCTLEAAEAVCDVDGDLGMDVLGGLESLVSRSLVRQVEGDARFTMLETIREFALEQLEASGELAAVRARHADFFVELAEQAQPWLEREEAGVWLDRLQLEHDNLRAALAWGAETSADVDVLPRLAGSFWQFWWMRGHFAEGRRWLDQALARPSAAPRRLRILNGAGQLAFFQDDTARAGEVWSEQLELARETGDQRYLVDALGRLGYLASRLGDHARAVALADESVALSRQAGEKSIIRRALHNRALVAVGQDDYQYAEELWEECLPLVRELGPGFMVGHTLQWLGRMAAQRGDLGRAMALTEEAVGLFRRRGDRFGLTSALGAMLQVGRRQGDHVRVAAAAHEDLVLNHQHGNRSGVCKDLEYLAWVARAGGDPARAARLLGAFQALRDELNWVPSPTQRAEYDAEVRAVREALGADELQAAWTAGRVMTTDQAIRFALEDAGSG
jgi:predicted ATPase/DNA-binding XRE family transcriptional regulator